MGFSSKLTYPNAHQSEQSDNYHGVIVADPYRWLENPDSEETQAWIAEENKVTSHYLENIRAKQQIQQRLTQLWDYEKYGSPFKRGGRYFYFKNDGLQNQSVLYALNSLEDEPKILLDPNQLSEDGTVAYRGYLSAMMASGSLMACPNQAQTG